MNKLILIIMFLLLCPSLILAEEESGISDEDADNYKASSSIGHDMFLDVYNEYGCNYRLASLLMAFKYMNMGMEVIKDVPNWYGTAGLALFYKHENKYKYHLDTKEMFYPSVQVLKGMLDGYKLGYMEAIKQYTEGDFTGIADTIPERYEKYLEEKKEKQLKQKENQADRKEKR